MKKSQQQAFSLIEVMIIFTVMAIIMAASMPMITGRSKGQSGPSSTEHGVYECMPVDNGDGTISFSSRIYKYKGGRLDSGSVLATEESSGAKCTFSNIPKNVKRFKVDIYSAGAGGTNYADLKAEKRDRPITGEITLAHLPGILNGEDGSRTYGLNPEQIANMFAGRTVRRSVSLGDGGDGGDASFEYISPAEAVCKAALSTALPQSDGKSLNDLMSIYNSLAIYSKLGEIYSHVKALREGNPTLNGGLVETNYEKLVNWIGNKEGTIPPTTLYMGVKLPVYTDLQEQLDVLHNHIGEADFDATEVYQSIQKSILNIRSNIYEDVKIQNGGSYSLNVEGETIELFTADKSANVSEMRELIKTVAKKNNESDIIAQSLYTKIYSGADFGIRPLAMHPHNTHNINGGGFDYSSGNAVSYGISNTHKYSLGSNSSYDGRYDLMFPNNDDGGDDSKLVDQLNSYCEALYPEYYYDKGSTIPKKYLAGNRKNDENPVSLSTSGVSNPRVKMNYDPDTGKYTKWYHDGTDYNISELEAQGDSKYPKFRENYFIIKPAHPNQSRTMSEVKQAGGKGGHGGAVVMEYTLPNISVVPSRYQRRWRNDGSCGFPSPEDFVGDTDKKRFFAAHNALAYYSDLYNANSRDECGAPYEKNRFTISGKSETRQSIAITTEATDTVQSGTSNTNREESTDPTTCGVPLYKDAKCFFGGTGGDAVGKPGFVVPRYNGDDSWVQIKPWYSANGFSTIVELATGGKGGHVGYVKYIDNLPIMFASGSEVWRAYWGDIPPGTDGKKSVYPLGGHSFTEQVQVKTQAPNGNSTQFQYTIDRIPTEYVTKPSYNYIRSLNPNDVAPVREDISGNNAARFRFGGAQDPIFEEPRIVVTKDGYDVSYIVGGPGERGRHETYTAYDLGSKCNIFLSDGGEPLNISISDSDNKTAVIENYKRMSATSLATTITCTNSDGQTVFNKILPGGAYNFSSLISAAFMKEVDLEDQKNNNYQSIEGESNIFARFADNVVKYITDWFNDATNEYRKNIGMGGHGIIVPKCTAGGNGEIKAEVHRFRGTQDGVLSDLGLWAVEGASSPQLSNSGEDGSNLRIDDEGDTGISCESLGGIIDTSDKAKNITYYKFRSGNIHTEGANSVTSAGKGGPGAVIITW